LDAAVSPTLDYSPLGIFVLKLLPFSLMGGLTSCLSFFSGFRRGRRHRRLASIESGELNRLHVQVGSSAEVDSSACTTAYATPPMSPADSCSSASSGALCSGLPSPTGHCRSPDRAASGQAENLADVINSCDIYLKMHVLDTNETVMFVHKKLKPIRTKIGEDPPPSDYKPLLRTLIEQSAAKHATQAPQPAPALPYAPVVATIRIVNGKGVVSPVNNAAVIPVCA